MSTDYDVACHTCRRALHLGVRFTVGWAFGNGTGDTDGQRAVGNWIMKHVNLGHEVRIHVDAPDDFARDHFDDWTDEAMDRKARQ